MTHSSFVELGSPCFKAAETKADFVRVRITLSDIASGQVGNLVDQLMQLSDTKEGVSRWKDRLIIGIEKSQTEPRDVSEIPEVVEYFRLLTTQWPFWSHFAEKECGTVGAVLRLLIGSEYMPRVGGIERMLTDADAVRAVSKRLYDQMKPMYRCHGLSEADEINMAKSITRAVNAMFHKSPDAPRS